MGSLQQSIQIKAMLLLLLIMSPVELEFKVRSNKPPCTRSSVADRAPRAASVWGSNTSETAANSSTAIHDSGFVFWTTAPGSAPISTISERGSCYSGKMLALTPSGTSGIIGVAADIEDALQWGGKGEFAGEFCNGAASCMSGMHPNQSAALRGITKHDTSSDEVGRSTFESSMPMPNGALCKATKPSA